MLPFYENDTVSDQRRIFRTYVLKFQGEKTKTPCIFSFTLGHGEMIFDDPHTKSVHLKNFVKFPILSGPNKYPFFYRTSTKINVKKKSHALLVQYHGKNSSWCFRYCCWAPLHVFIFLILPFHRPWLFFLTFFWIFSGFIPFRTNLAISTLQLGPGNCFNAFLERLHVEVS